MTAMSKHDEGASIGRAAATAIAQEIVGKGRLAAAMVFANGPPQQLVMPVELVVRGSTARPRS